MTNTTKKMSNEGHEGKVPMGGSIAAVFIIGLVVGAIVTFLAVAGRTQGVIEQRRELLKAEQAKSPKPAQEQGTSTN